VDLRFLEKFRFLHNLLPNLMQYVSEQFEAALP
jgi:hypothetical protein